MEDLKERDMLNFLLGKYIAYSCNDPKKYPKKPALGYEFGGEKKKMSDEDMERMAMNLTNKLGGKIIK